MMEKRGPSRKAARRRGLRLSATVLALNLAAAPLLAQALPGAQTPSAVDSRSLHLPSEKTAFTLSLSGTLVSYGLLFISMGSGGTGDAPSEVSSGIGLAGIAGAMVGPSLGSFYGGCWGRGLLMSGLRLGACMAVLAYSLNHDEENLTALGIGLVGVMVASSVYECATVKSAVRKHNAAHMANRGLNVVLAPFALRKGGGVQVRLSF